MSAVAARQSAYVATADEYDVNELEARFSSTRARREAPVPLQIGQLQQETRQSNLLSPTTTDMTRGSFENRSSDDRSNEQSYESDRIHSDNSSHEQTGHDGETSISADNVPRRQSSRRAMHRKNDDEQQLTDAEESSSREQLRLLADGTPVPKMPPIPQSIQSRSRKAKPRRNRSPVLSFDGAAAEEELKLSQWQVLPDDPRRISTLGPKVKRNAPAPWELGGEELLADERRIPGMESIEKPFARLKQRPSVDHSYTPALPFGLSSRYAPKHRATEQDAEKENDTQSLFASQRSRSKSVSNSAVGMLKGLGLAAAASAPASTKAKLTKALRYVGGGSDEAKVSAPLKNLSSGLNVDPSGMPAPAFSRYDGTGLSSSPSSRTITGNNSAPLKSPTDLADLLLSANTKYRDQACSPPLPPSASGRFASTQSADTRSLASTRPSLLSNTSSDDASSLRQSSSKDSGVSRATTRPSESDDHVNSDHAEASKAEVDTTLTSPLSGREAEPAPLSPLSKGANHLPFPVPGSMEGVQYKLISLEQAREQARLRQTEWLANAGNATAMQTSVSMMSTDTFSEDAIGFKDGVNDYLTGKMLRNKKSGFLRKLKKDKGFSGEFDTASTDYSNSSSRDTEYTNNAQVPSFSVTGLDDETQPKSGLATSSPALSIRPVSSMFSGFTADFLDASAISEGHVRETSNGSTSSTSGHLAPHSPALSSFRSQDMSRSPSLLTPDGGQFLASTTDTTAPLSFRAKSGETKSSPHESSFSRRVPSLDASTSDGHSHSQSPVTSPTVPSFHHTVSSFAEPAETEEFAPSSPMISEEVAEQARKLEEQIRALSDELRELRIQHAGHGTPANHAQETDRAQVELQVGNCPSCGCGCAEERRLQSINEAAVLTGASILDRGRALKSAKNMVTTGRFGGYSSR